MFEPGAGASIDVCGVVDQARTHWAYARSCAAGHGIELYAKVAHRTRVERGTSVAQASIHVAREAGVATRVWRETATPAGFAAASGFSRHTIINVLERALDRSSIAPGDPPELDSGVEHERWDLDALEDSPTRAEIDSAFVRFPSLEALEAGTTVEVLVGPGGWFTARRRQRVWVNLQGMGPRLLAKRGFKDWGALLEGPAGAQSADRCPQAGITPQFLVLQPQAAAPIVSALASRFYVAESSPQFGAGSGWGLVDDPLRVDGLAGGSFDDAGFPARARLLAAAGTSIGCIWGPGTFWRRSFRSPPIPSTSNLWMPPDKSAPAGGTTVTASTSRMLPLGPDIWVLELEFGRKKGYVRLTPHEWLERVAGTAGIEHVTSDGPILRSVLLKDMPGIVMS